MKGETSMAAPINRESSTSQIYVFWLSKMSTGVNRSELTRCVISKSDIAIESGTREIIPLSIVKRCDEEAFGGPGSFVVRVKLQIYGRSEPIYLRLANPLDPHLPLHRQASETKAFVTVVNAFRSGESTLIEPNPYLREFANRRKQPPDKFVWDANMSPWQYFDFLHPRPTNRKIILICFLIILFLGAFILLLSTIFGGIRITLG